MIVVTPEFRKKRRSWGPKLLLILSLAFYGFVAFVVVVRSQSGLSPSPLPAIVIALLPVCAYLAFRHPMIFPFVLYVGFLPFDSLLSVTSGATLARLVAGATAGAMILRLILLRRAFIPHRSWYFFGAMVVYAAISLLWDTDGQTGTEEMTAIGQLFLFMTILAIYPASKSEFKTGLGLFVPCGVISALYAMQAYYFGGSAARDASDRVELTSGGVLLDFNYYAGSFLLPISIAMYFTFYGRQPIVRLASGIGTLIMMIGLLLTGSRGAFLSAVAILAYFAIRSKFRVQVISFIGLAGLVSLFFPSVYLRFVNDPSQQGSASGRTFIWETGLHSLKEHWLFGNGIGSFASTYDKNFLDVYQAKFQGWTRPSHNLFIGVVTELGIIGMVFVVAAWYTSVRQLKIIDKANEWFGLRLAFEGAIFSLLFLGLSIDPMYVKYIWLAHSMALMLMNQVAPREFRLPNASRSIAGQARSPAFGFHASERIASRGS
jgi:O-antigen ligase